MTPEYYRAVPVAMKGHSVLNERWLQDRIAEDTTLLGLGELRVRDYERRQPRAGRLDLLLEDVEQGVRYEVELQLGPTDETHIIRTIEYWDIERSRYPQYEHIAVLVAEDVTSRFLNVIRLFNRAIPLIAIQMRALEVNGTLTLHAATVVNYVPLGPVEEDEPGQPVQRDYWVGLSSEETVGVADEVLSLIKEVVPSTVPKYNQQYIGITPGRGGANNFVTLTPQKRKGCLVKFRIERSDDLTSRLEASDLESLSYEKSGYYRLRLQPGEVESNRDLLLELIRQASRTPDREEA